MCSHPCLSLSVSLHCHSVFHPCAHDMCSIHRRRLVGSSASVKKARLMAASQGNPEVKIAEVLEQLVHENRALKVEVGAMRVQMAEMMSIMQTLKNGIITKTAAAENPGGIETIVPSPKPNSIPLPGPGIRHLVHTQEGTNQNHPATQTLNPITMSQRTLPDFIPSPITSPQVQNLNPTNSLQALHSSTQVRKSHKAPKNQEHRQFDPIPMPYSDLFNHLLSIDLITTRSMKPLQPPIPRSYNANAACEFHEGGIGHTLEDCKAFKHAVQDLIESKWLSFNDSSASGVLAKESGETSAMMSQGKSSRFNSIPVSYTDLYSHLASLNVVSPRSMKPIQAPFPRGYKPKDTCEFHVGAVGHSIEDCKSFKYAVQNLIDAKQLVFKKDGKELMVNLDPQNSVVIRLRIGVGEEG